MPRSGRNQLEPRHDRFIILVFSNYNWCDSSFLFFFFWSLSAQTPDKSYSSNSWVCWLHGQTWENEDSCFPRRLRFGYPILARSAFSTVIYFFPLHLHVLSDLFCSSGMTQGGSFRRRPSHGAALSSSLLSVCRLWPQRGATFNTSHRI